jgi:hypothetical protein
LIRLLSEGEATKNGLDISICSIILTTKIHIKLSHNTNSILLRIWDSCEKFCLEKNNVRKYLGCPKHKYVTNKKVKFWDAWLVNDYINRKQFVAWILWNAKSERMLVWLSITYVIQFWKMFDPVGLPLCVKKANLVQV